METKLVITANIFFILVPVLAWLFFPGLCEFLASLFTAYALVYLTYITHEIDKDLRRIRMDRKADLVDPPLPKHKLTGQ